MKNSTRISRKDKKILRSIFLCHTGNPLARKEKISKSKWIRLKSEYIIWFKLFSRSERTIGNTV